MASSASTSPCVIPSARRPASSSHSAPIPQKSELRKTEQILLSQPISSVPAGNMRSSPQHRRSTSPFEGGIGKMWEGEPNWTDAQLRKIRIPVWVVDGEHDEGIKRDHTEYMAATIPGARTLRHSVKCQPFRVSAGSRRIQQGHLELPRRAAAGSIKNAESTSLMTVESQLLNQKRTLLPMPF